MRMMLIFFLCITFFESASAHENKTEFSVKPGLCVIDKDQNQCHAQLQATWKHPEKVDSRLCLYQAQQEKAVYCENEAAKQAEISWQSDLEHNTPFYLKKQTDEKTIAETTVEVAKLVTDVRPRRRYGWSIF